MPPRGMKTIKLSFGSRLALAVGILTLVTVGTLAIVAWLTSSRALEHEIQIRLNTILQVREEQTSLYIVNTFTALHLIASRLIIQSALSALLEGRSLNAMELETGMRDLRSSVESYRGVYMAEVLDTNGVVVFNNQKNVVEDFFATHPSLPVWPAGCCGGSLSDSYTINVTESITSQAYVFIIRIAQTDAETVSLGTLRLLISSDELYQILAGRAGLEDSRGQVVLAHPYMTGARSAESFSLVLPAAHDPISGVRPLAAYPCLQQFVQNDGNATGMATRQCSSYNGVLVQSASLVVGSLSSWVLIAEIPRTVISQPILALRNYLLIGVFVNLFISLALSATCARRAVRPLRRLRSVAKEFSKGNFEARSRAPTPLFLDEVSELTLTFNEMAGYLQDLYVNLEEKVAERTKELNVANGAKSSFLASMSHEIRTPLNGIIGMASLLVDTRPVMTNEQSDMAASIRECAESLLTIVNDVLDFSKIEAGKMTLEERPIDVRHMSQACVYLLMPRAKDKGIALTIEVAPETPTWIRGDPVRLQQVLLNLMTNAIKFTSCGSVTLSIAPSEVGSEPPTICFSVQDTGIGISPDALSLLFKSFTQVDATITRKYGGTGLGLAISKSLAELMGGSIRVKSVEHVGSTFTLCIPLEPASSPTPIPSISGKAEPAADLRSITILLAEDNAVNVKVAVALLRKMNLTCDVVMNGRQAVEAVKGKAYDLVLMDMQMPEMGGLEATRLIRQLQLEKQPVIIALTANAMDGDEKRCLESGMNSYLSKPIRYPELRQCVETHVYPATSDSVTVTVE